MAVKVGSFAKSTAAATASQAVTDVGFTPVALILWCSGATTDEGWTDGMWPAIGMTTGAANSYSIGGGSVDAAASSNTSRRVAAKAFTMVTGSESLLAECDLTSFDSGGFTLSWTTNNNVAYIINYLALSASEVTNAKVLQFYNPSTTGNASQTGAGFQPELVIIGLTGLFDDPGSPTLPVSRAATGMLSLGAMTASAQWSTSICPIDAAGTSDTARQQYSNHVVYHANKGTVRSARATYVSLDADGFTLNWDAALNGGHTPVIALCLAGGNFAVGTFDTAATSGAQSVTGIGFTPSAVMLTTLNTATVNNATQVDGVNMAIGASDGTNHRVCSFKDEDNLADTNVCSYVNDAVALLEQDDAGSDLTRTATVSAFGSDGFTLTWSGEGNAYKAQYIAFGSPAAAGRVRGPAVQMM